MLRKTWWCSYTKYRFIRNGDIRNSSEIFGKFKKRMSNLPIQNFQVRKRQKKKIDAHCAIFFCQSFHSPSNQVNCYWCHEVENFWKVAWIQSHHLQWKFKLWAGKFAECCQQTLENKKFVDITQQCFALLLQVNFPANNLNFHWRWWDRIQATF